MQNGWMETATRREKVRDESCTILLPLPLQLLYWASHWHQRHIIGISFRQVMDGLCILATKALCCGSGEE